MAERTGLEPATPGVTGRYSNQLNYRSVRKENAASQGGDTDDPAFFGRGRMLAVGEARFKPFRLFSSPAGTEPHRTRLSARLLTRASAGPHCCMPRRATLSLPHA